MEHVVGRELAQDVPVYRPPILRRYGKMTVVTQGGSPGMGDGMSGMQQPMMM